MPIYRLEPIEGLKSHNDWRASHVGPMAVWVKAQDADDARQKMQLATVITIEDYEEGQRVPFSPWTNSAVVNCDEDYSHHVPDGVALLGNGKTITL